MWLAGYEPQAIISFEKMPIWDYYTVLDKKIEIVERQKK